VKLAVLVPTLIAALFVLSGLASAQDNTEPAQQADPLSPVGPVGAEEADPIESAQISAALKRRLTAEYLTDDEKQDLRIRHGLWQESDLDTPARRAMAARIVGAFWDPAFENELTPPYMRAWAALQAGRLREAIDLVEGQDSMRALQVRVEALYELGRLEEAVRASEPALELARTRSIDHPAEAAAAAMALNTRVRITGPIGGAEDLKGLVGMLTDARTRLGPLSWEPRLAEAQLLFERGARSEAIAAATEALAFNPRLNDAIAVFAEAHVDSFNFTGAAEAAEAMDENLRTLPNIDDEDRVIAGVLAQARGRIRSADGDGARELVEPFVERFPAHRGLHAMLAASYARSFDFEEMNRELAEFQQLSPGSAAAELMTGYALSQARQYAEASERLNAAARLEPNNPDVWTELGLLEVQWGRDAQALDALTRAVELDPFHVRADNSRRLIAEILTYPTVETEHFIIRYQEGIDEVLVREMPEALEAMHDRVTGDGPGGIRHEPRAKTIIELMPDHARFSVRITGGTHIWTVAAATGRLIAMEAPKAGPRNTKGPYDWLRVVRHEYTHTVTLDRTRNRLPHWFTEAAAVYMEDAPRDTQRSRLLANKLAQGDLFDMDGINLGFVRPEKPEDRSLAYAQGHWMYEYMINTYGDTAPLAIMDRYAEGFTEAEAYEDVLGVTRETFYADFLTWANEQVIAWGLKVPEGVPTLNEMRLAEVAGDENAEDAEEEDAEDDKPELTGLAQLIEQGPDAMPELGEDWIIDRLAEYPEHPQLLAELVRLAIASNGGEADASMITLLERLAAARPVDDAPHRLLAKLYLDGKGAIADKDRSAAIPHLEWLDVREVYSPVYAAELARQYAELEQLDKAIDKAERAVRIAPYEPEYRELAARIALLGRDLATAQRHIKALTMLEPGQSTHERRLEAIRRMRDAA